MARDMLLAVAPHERGQNRLYNVASLRCALHPGGSENLDGHMPIIGSVHGWMELVHLPPTIRFAQRGV
jgi:hypothetical protein